MKVAVIPARGGSQRIPRKNIRLFAGKPIISYSIGVAIASDLFDRVIVSTDDEEIASIAIDCGAEIPALRPKELADHYTGTNEVVKHTVWCLLESGESVEYACCIYATAPLLRTEYLAEGLRRLVGNPDRDFAFSVTSFPFPIQRAIRIGPDEAVRPFFPEYIGSRSQDLDDAYHDAGQFYWGRATAFLDDAPLFSERSIGVQLPRHLVQDIDTTEDWTRAELMYAALAATKG